MTTNKITNRVVTVYASARTGSATSPHTSRTRRAKCISAVTAGRTARITVQARVVTSIAILSSRARIHALVYAEKIAIRTVGAGGFCS